MHRQGTKPARLNSPHAVKIVDVFNIKDKYRSYFGQFHWELQVTCQGRNPASCPVTAKDPAQVHVQSTYLLHRPERINRREGVGWK